MLGLVPLISNATEYCVRADGTAVTKQNAIGVSSGPENCMNMHAFNYESFTPGDTIYFSAQGGPFVSGDYIDNTLTIMHLPSSGSVDNPIVYSGVPENVPLIDASRSVRSSGAIHISDIDHVIIKNFNVKGSGGVAAFHVLGDSGVSGYGVHAENINVLSAYGYSRGNHDCFSMKDNAQVEYLSISATKCRPEFPPYEGSHQAITGHGDSKYTVNSARFSDSNYIVTNTFNTTGYLYNVTASEFYVYGFTNGLNSTSKASTVIDNSDINVDSGAPLFSSNSVEGEQSELKFINSNIYSSNSRTAVIKSDVYLSGNNIVIDDQGWSYLSIGGDVYFSDNKVYIQNIGGAFLRVDSLRGGRIYIKNNIFILSDIVGDFLFGFSHEENSGVISHNVFRDYSGLSKIIKIYDYAKAPLLQNNLFYNTEVGGVVVETGNAKNDGAMSSLKIYNNIFFNANDIVKSNGEFLIDADSNNYFGGGVLMDVNGVFDDPLFLSDGMGYYLSQASPLIDSGVSFDVDTDLEGNPIWNVIDIGPFEFQPNDVDYDSVLNVSDNCINISNHDQLDSDGDNIGDVCDALPSDLGLFEFQPNDADYDSVLNVSDNCINISNHNQLDSDGDNIGDACDALPSDLGVDAEGSVASGRLGFYVLLCMCLVPTLFRVSLLSQ